MALYREEPKCTFCGEILAKAKYKDQSDLLTSMQLIGDTFEGWEYQDHECKGSKEFMATLQIAADIRQKQDNKNNDKQ